ncbi:MAG: TIGR01212 family radical SAM protein [Clostridia bacterium]|nr:TIGR01212 family radical SAM protein [Clostridia bacterium]
MNNRYNYLNEYLKQKYGERTLKICIDGGFTCPNRDGKVSHGGCIFCGERGSGEHLMENSIQKQVYSYINSYRGERANSFIAYFQNFSNTYDTIENLRKRYDVISSLDLGNKKIKVLDVATRPDCIDKDICSLLNSYKNKFDIWVELGLQTSSDKTASIINRGYESSIFTKAVKLLNLHNIDVIAHIMIGLPEEGMTELKKTIDFINSHNIQGLKIHSTYVIKNTVLEKMYNAGQYTPLSLDSYIEQACYVLTHINPNIIIHKISGDAPKDLLVAPSWNSHKKLIMNGINKYLETNDLHQGQFYISNNSDKF